MAKSLFAAAFLCGIWSLLATTANGQITRPFDGPGAMGKSLYAAAESRPTVSPYLNLGVTPSGLSNYQTLVRPLIEERESLNRQRAELERLNSRMTGAPVRNEPNPMGNGGRAGSSVRFMHYSHYFGTNR